MANTMTNMTTSVFAEAVALGARTRLTNIKAFSMSLDTDLNNTNAGTVIVPVLGDVTAAPFDEDSNNYETGDTTDEGVSVVADQHVVAKAKYTDRELMSSPKTILEKKGEKCGYAIGRSVVIAAFGKITKGSFSKEIKIALADFGPERVASLADDISDLDIDPASCSLTLNGPLYSRLLGQLSLAQYGDVVDVKAGLIKGLYGFGQIVKADLLKGAVPTLLGFANTPDALAIGSKYVQPGSSKVYEEVGMAYDEAAGIVVGIRRFGSAAKGTNSLAVECLYGIKAVNTKQLVRFVAA